VRWQLSDKNSGVNTKAIPPRGGIAFNFGSQMLKTRRFGDFFEMFPKKLLKRRVFCDIICIDRDIDQNSPHRSKKG
jgi:hypothetical protein